jgi:hypothetical protein
LLRAAIAISLWLLLSGCATLPQGCFPPARAMVTADLTFGRNIGHRIGVSETEFAAFLASEVTPRFPDGLTVLDAGGQWRDRSGALIREPAKLVRVIFADDVARRDSLAAIAETYKQRFRQESVLMSLHTSCVTF